MPTHQTSASSTPAELTAWAAEQTCPCGHRGLTITYRLAARPVGAYSLSGAQMKFSAREVPVLGCPGCGAEAVGHH